MRLRNLFARNLRRLRRADGLSQEELAGRAGLNRNYIGMLERTEYAATLDVVERLADALGVDAVILLSADGGLESARKNSAAGQTDGNGHP